MVDWSMTEIRRKTWLARSQKPLKRTPLKPRKAPLRGSKTIPYGKPKVKVKKVQKVIDKRPKVWGYKRADREFSQWIRARDGKCFFCPNPATQNSHYWGRGNWPVRFDPENCDGICGGCHLKHESSKHGLYRTMKIAQLGRARHEALARKAVGQMKKRDAIAEVMVFLSPPSKDADRDDGKI